MTSDFSAMVTNGDLNLYEVDPFELDNREVPTVEMAPGLFDSLTSTVFTGGADLDHTEVMGFSLLNFDVFE